MKINTGTGNGVKEVKVDSNPFKLAEGFDEKPKATKVSTGFTDDKNRD
jgi:hypothetical protein